MKLESVFGDYAKSLQQVVDKSLGLFAPVWHERYFRMGIPSATLDYTTMIGKERINAAASVIARGSSAPIRSRAGLIKLSGQVPAISEKFVMDENDYRNMMLVQNMSVSDESKRNQMLDLLFNDTKKAGDAAHKRLDIMAMQAISTGTISLTIETNPDGLTLSEPIDLLMPDANRRNAAVAWSSASTATPITDIRNTVYAAAQMGRTFEKMIMSWSLFNTFCATKEVQDTLKAFYYGPKPGGSFDPVAVTLLSNVNDFLSRNMLPIIEINNEVIGIEKDGLITTFRPFNQTNVSFIPAGIIGEIKNAYAIEEMSRVDKVTYALYGRALISKWKENDPFQELTKVELNAIPSLNNIDLIYILDTNP